MAPIDELDHLLLELQNGSKEAFDRLFEKYWYQFYLYACRQRLAHQSAEDATQNFFMRVLEKVQLFNPAVGPARNWLYRVCHSEVVNVQRRLKRTSSESLLSDPEGVDDIADELTVEELVEIAERDEAIERCWAESRAALSVTDQQEIQREEASKKRGRKTAAWHLAMHRRRSFFVRCVERKFPDSKDTPWLRRNL